MTEIRRQSVLALRNALALIIVATAALVIPTARAVASQEARRASVMTAKGDLVEGILKTVNDTEAVVEVAGQTIRLPLADIRYISFVGKIEGGVGVSAPAVSPMEKALTLLKDLRAATQVGMLRAQYSQKLVETLPSVQAFIDAEDGQWVDVRNALKHSISRYQLPLYNLEFWGRAGEFMAQGGASAEYAIKLASMPGEARHIEDPAEKSIALGEEARGRLGSGDKPMPSGIDRNTQGGPNDVYNFVLPQRQRVTIEMVCNACIPNLTVLLAGKPIEDDLGPSGKATIKFDAHPNRYQIWAGTHKDSVGEYVLKIMPTR